MAFALPSLTMIEAIYVAAGKFGKVDTVRGCNKDWNRFSSENSGDESLDGKEWNARMAEEFGKLQN